MTVQITDKYAVRCLVGLSDWIVWMHWRTATSSTLSVEVTKTPPITLQFSHRRLYTETDMISGDCGQRDTKITVPTSSIDPDNNNFWKAIVPFFASVLAHELTHREHWKKNPTGMCQASSSQNAAKLGPTTPAEDWITKYYGLQHELEAHAAQIAFEICVSENWSVPNNIIDSMNSTCTWRRISSRLSSAEKILPSKWQDTLGQFEAQIASEVHNHLTMWV